MPYREGYNREKKAAADKRYAEKNKDKVNYIKSKSSAKSFILKKCTKDDLKEVEKWIKEREEILCKEN